MLGLFDYSHLYFISPLLQTDLNKTIALKIILLHTKFSLLLDLLHSNKYTNGYSRNIYLPVFNERSQNNVIVNIEWQEFIENY